MRKIDYLGFIVVAALTVTTFSNLYKSFLEKEKINTLIQVERACSE